MSHNCPTIKGRRYARKNTEGRKLNIRLPANRLDGSFGVLKKAPLLDGVGNVRGWVSTAIRVNYGQDKYMPPPDILPGHFPRQLQAQVKRWRKHGKIMSIRYVFAYRAAVHGDKKHTTGQPRRVSGWVPVEFLEPKSRKRLKAELRRAKVCLREHEDRRVEVEAWVHSRKLKATPNKLRVPDAIPIHGEMPQYPAWPPGIANWVEFVLFGNLWLAPGKKKKGAPRKKNGSKWGSHGRAKDYYPRTSETAVPFGYVNICYNVGSQGGIATDSVPVGTSFYVIKKKDGADLRARMTLWRPAHGAIKEPHIQQFFHKINALADFPQYKDYTDEQFYQLMGTRRHDEYVYGFIKYVVRSKRTVHKNGVSPVPTPVGWGHRFGWVPRWALESDPDA